MSTGRRRSFWPGCLAWNLSTMPSSGWMRMTRAFGCMSRTAFGGNDWCGTGRNWMKTSDARTGSRLPGADVERHVLPAPVVDEELDGRERLGRRVVRHAGLGDIGRHPLAAHPPGAVLPADGDIDRPGPAGIGRTARSTSTILLRTSSGLNDTSGSIAVRHMSCMMWFWTMSRRAPALS